MKKFLQTLPAIIMIISLTTINVMAEETDEPEKPKRKVNTIFSSYKGDMFVSGYGAVTPAYTRIKGKDALLVGGRGGLILDNFVIGLAGAGLTYPHKTKDFTENVPSDDKTYVNFGYGGALIEYYFFPKKLIHFSIGTTIGAGGLNLSSEEEDDNDDRNGDAFFTVEPEANVFVNITRFCRLGIGASYRYINGINNDIFKDKDFSGASVKFIAAFGWF